MEIKEIKRIYSGLPSCMWFFVISEVWKGRYKFSDNELIFRDWCGLVTQKKLSEKYNISIYHIRKSIQVIQLELIRFVEKRIELGFIAPLEFEATPKKSTSEILRGFHELVKSINPDIKPIEIPKRFRSDSELLEDFERFVREILAM